MKTRQTFYFADEEDLTPLLQELEAVEAVRYYQTGLFDSPGPIYYRSLFEAGKIGVVLHGDWNHTKSYLVLPGEVDVIVTPVPQRKGGIKYAIDQEKNLSSIIVKPSGVFQQGILVAGKIGTIYDNEVALRLFKSFSSPVKKCFHRIGDFYVGDSARAKLAAGWRLVTMDQSPKEYDLKLGWQEALRLFANRQKISVKRGLLRSRPIYLCTPAFKKMVEEEKLTGFEFEIAHLE